MLLWDVRPSEAKKRHHKRHIRDTFVSLVLNYTVKKTPLCVRNAPVKDVGQVKLQQTLSQGCKRQEAGVEEEQKYQPSAHGEAVRHGAVLQGQKQDRECVSTCKNMQNSHWIES